MILKIVFKTIYKNVQVKKQVTWHTDTFSKMIK